MGSTIHISYDYFCANRVSKSVQEWLKLYRGANGDRLAAFGLMQLTLDCLVKTNENRQNDIVLPPDIRPHTFDFEKFMQNGMRRQKYDVELQKEEGQRLGVFMEKLVLQSKNTDWMDLMPSFYHELIANKKSAIIAAKPLAAWFIGCLKSNIGEEFADKLQQLRGRLVTTITQHIRMPGAIKIVIEYIIDAVNKEPEIIRSDTKEFVSIIAWAFEFNDAGVNKTVLMYVHSVFQSTNNNNNRQSVLELCSDRLVIEQLKGFITRCHKNLLKKALDVAIALQEFNPGEKLFHTHTYKLIMTSDNVDVQRLAADLFYKTFYNPNDSAEFIKVLTQFSRANRMKRHSYGNRLINAFWSHGVLTDWKVVFEAISRNINNNNFVVECLYNLGQTIETAKLRIGSDGSLKNFISRAITFMNNLDRKQVNYMAKMIEIVARTHEELKLVARSQLQILANVLKATLVGYFNAVDHLTNAIGLGKILEGLKIPVFDDISRNDLLMSKFHEMRTNYISSFPQITADLESHDDLMKIYISTCGFVMHGLAHSMAKQLVHDMWDDLVVAKRFSNIEWNQTLLGHSILILVYSWAVHLKSNHQQIPLASNIQLPQLIGLLFDLLDKMDRKASFLYTSIFTSLVAILKFPIAMSNFTHNHVQSMVDVLKECFEYMGANMCQFREDGQLWVYLETMISRVQKLIGVYHVDAKPLIITFYEIFSTAVEYMDGFLQTLAKANANLFANSIVDVLLIRSVRPARQAFAARVCKIIESVGTDSDSQQTLILQIQLKCAELRGNATIQPILNLIKTEIIDKF